MGDREWYNNLTVVQVYPRRTGELWKSPQCDGCYAILRPTEMVPDWISEHYAHRAEILDLPEYSGHSLWDNNSFHVREEFINGL